jgi:Type II secretion system (T2SS), protein M
MSPLNVRRQLQHRLAQLGVSGSLGLALLLLAVLCWLTLVRPGEREIESAGHKLQTLQQQMANRSSLPVNSALDREEQLRVFYNSLAAQQSVPDTLKRIYQAAQKHELVLETGEYSQLQQGSARLARFRVALPLKGSFSQLLAFMDAVLQENSNVALEGATFKRDKVTDEALDAKLVFLVFTDTKP